MPGLEYLKVEILYAALFEGARSIEDVLSRRTRISFETSDGGLSIAPEVAGIIAGVLGWSDAQVHQEISSYSQLIESQRNSALRFPEGTKRVS
jgi:glycerol-3-phosphate dehydrogenase